MIYSTPVLRRLGDCYFSIEFSDDADLEANFRVLALMQRIKSAALPGVLDVIPSMRQLAVVVAAGLRQPRVWERELGELAEACATPSTITSRTFVLPVWYQDPWSMELAQKNDEPHGIDMIAADLGTTVDGAIAKHSETDYWLACVGWAPGCFFAYPLDTHGVSLPKMETARTFTPERTLTVGGTCTAALPLDGPSGYRMLGRLAVPIYEPVPHTHGFPDSGVLFLAGDKHRYRPIDGNEYEAIRRAIDDGTYRYEVLEEEFDVRLYTERRAAQAQG